MKYLLIFVLILIVFLFSSYLYFYFKLENQAKIKKPDYGLFANLKFGKIFYQWFEPKSPNGEIIVLVHGFSTPSIVWKGIVPFFLNQGFKVLAYDHYGRGYSSRPNVKYTKEFYISTLSELLNILKIEQKIHLIGYSMGGPIVGHFANENEHRVSSVNFIAPAGYMHENQASRNIFLRILTLPIISNYVAIVFPSLMYGGNSSIEIKSNSDPNQISQQELENIYKEQMRYEGFTRSLLSTAKNFNLFNTKKMYQELGTKDLNFSVIWGSSDEIVSIEGLNSLKKDIPIISDEIIENGFHDITYAMPTKVGSFLVNKIKQFSKK
ncbi:MAG: alpha/beta hydrolase [Gammaproteobacteria bacterium]|nr:MAG: alpha/beta hydrolase [Gammaproteobacteria bacterium]